MVGGRIPSDTARTVATNSMPPAAPRRWPVMDLVDPKARRRACAPNTVFTAAVSVLSLRGVEVPWAFT
jgi:hypothetical protein